jgi:predicted secreted protein
VYSGVLQFTDQRESPARQRTMDFTLRGEGRDPVALDASMAADMTELVRRLANDTL